MANQAKNSMYQLYLSFGQLASIFQERDGKSWSKVKHMSLPLPFAIDTKEGRPMRLSYLGGTKKEFHYQQSGCW